jgi:uncharacterized protein (TIRG00374 family)
VRPAAAFVTIMVERLYDTIAVVSIFAVNLLWLKPSDVATEAFTRARTVGWSLVLLLAVVVTLLVCFKRRSHSVVGWLDRKIRGKSGLGARLKRALLSTLDQLATALGVMSNVRQLTISVGLSVLLWGSVALGNLLVCRAFGLPFGISQILFVMGWSMVGSAVPTPGGAAGAFHAATGAALVLLGVAREQAAAVAIILHLVDFAPAAFFGFFYFLRGDINITRLRALISVRSVEHAVEDEKVVLAESA